MADTTNSTAVKNGDKKAFQPRPQSKHQQLNKLYALPAPLRTFPMPTLIPHNPLSLFHILYVWLSQAIKPESSHHQVLFQGWFSPETRSVHVTDVRSIRGLWEQGFYGKGSLSRSEPSWLEREKTRRGTKAKKTSEEVTRNRRAERQQTKWERARKEREAIDQKLLEEAEAALEVDVRIDSAQNNAKIQNENPSLVPEKALPVVLLSKLDLRSPVGPLELLSLPNSSLELESSSEEGGQNNSRNVYNSIPRILSSPVGPLELLALPNSIYSATEPIEVAKTVAEALRMPNSNGNTAPKNLAELEPESNSQTLLLPNGSLHKESLQVDDSEVVGGSETNDDTIDGSTHSEDTVETNGTAPNGSALVNGALENPQIKRRKSVRFSPTVEKNTFIQTEPPSPEHGAITSTIEEQPLVIKDQEHTQLTLEEAFFLSYGLGALTVLDPETKLPISNQDLFTLFRKTSYFPPTTNQSLSPDDPFMINYVVYHHFRSLGWVPRSGVKFSVDLMLYVRGPVFTHAEFAVLILPSYSHPYWSSDVFLQKYVKSKVQRTWAWISSINRVIAQVKKTLILTYVDIPPPLDKQREKELSINEILGQYKVREIVMKRWVANRSRD